MLLHRKPDVCFTSKNQKTFNFNNNIAILKLNEVYDKCYFIPSIKDLSNKTIVIDTDKDSDKVITYYLLLKDKTGLDSFIISSPEGVDVIWQDGSIEMEDGKNYIIQFKQINDTTILVSLTNSTLTFSKEKPVPSPPVKREISAIYFNMPEEETLLYDMFTWYDEFKKSGETPAGAAKENGHEESVEFFVPQITNNILRWTSYKDYIIEDDMIKVLIKDTDEDIDEESFLKAWKNEIYPFFNLHVYYKSRKLIINENIKVENYPLIWDKNDEVDTYSKIVLCDTLYFIWHKFSYCSNLSVSNLNNNCKAFTSAVYHTSTTGWQWWGTIILNGDGSYIKPDGYSVDHIDNISIKTIFEKGFKLYTKYITDSGTNKNAGAYYEFSFNSAKLNANSIPVMPYGDMYLNYLKFEYKDANN